MAVQQSKVSKSRVRIRKASNRYEGVQASTCTQCGAPCLPHRVAPCLPHRVCKACGYYGGKQVLTIKEKKTQE